MQAAPSKVTSNLSISIQSGIKDTGPAQATSEVHMLKTQALKSWRNESYLKQGYDPWRRGKEKEKEKGRDGERDSEQAARMRRRSGVIRQGEDLKNKWAD